MRTLRKTPSFTCAVIATLALTTGATAAIFSVVNSVLLRPLPFPAPDRLVEVTETGQVGGPGAVLYGDLEEFRRQSVAFEGFAIHGLSAKQLERPSGLVRLSAVLTDREFFSVLGSRASGRPHVRSERCRARRRSERSPVGGAVQSRPVDRRQRRDADRADVRRDSCSAR